MNLSAKPLLNTATKVGLSSQPDDPGSHSASEIQVVRFRVKAFGDREDALIGDNYVGYVESIYWGRLNRAWYCCTLFHAPLTFNCDSLVKARRALLHRIADWYDNGGDPLHAELSRCIRLQADEIAP